MHGPFFGEFMGTMVLILLGDGVVANVLLKKSKGEGSGWIVITTGWGIGSDGRHLYGDRLRKLRGATSIPRSRWLWPAIRQVGHGSALLGSSVRRRLRWRNPNLAGLSAPLGSDRRSGSQAGHLLHWPRDPQSSRNPDRNHRDHHADLRRLCVWRYGRFAERSASGLRSVSVGLPGLGARSVPRWPDRIRYEPCT